jgi:tetratricopeptide (TPR) repeat protein
MSRIDPPPSDRSSVNDRDAAEGAFKKYAKANDLAFASEDSEPYPDPYEAWGAILAKQGNLKDAIEKYEQAIKIDPNDPDDYYTCGELLEKQGNLDAATTMYERAVELHHPDTERIRSRILDLKAHRSIEAPPGIEEPVRSAAPSRHRSHRQAPRGSG